MSTDFFAVQRRQQIISKILIAAVFALLWLIANLLVGFEHRGFECSELGWCQNVWQPNLKVLLLTALAVGGYLCLAPLVARRAAVDASNVRPADGPSGAVLRNVVAEMAIAAGIPTPRSYVVDDRALNAFAISNGNRRGAIVCTTGLLATLDRRELTGVVAHEVAHIRHRDSTVILVAVLGLGALSAVVAIALGVAAASQSGDEEDSSPIAIAALIFAIVFAVVAIPAALLLRAALSRRREQLADASAVQYTRDPTGLRRALEKLADSTVPLRRSGFATRPLWIDAPARLHAPGGLLDRLLDTHPPIGKRIAWLHSLERAST